VQDGLYDESDVPLLQQPVDARLGDQLSCCNLGRASSWRATHVPDREFTQSLIGPQRRSHLPSFPTSYALCPRKIISKSSSHLQFFIQCARCFLSPTCVFNNFLLLPYVQQS